MTVAIIGDSFSCDNVDGSWIQRLEHDGFELLNFSQRGISQYRLYKNIKNNLEVIRKSNCVIIWHTNANRIFVNDYAVFPSRLLDSHPCVDLVANDSINSSDHNWKNIAINYYKYFFDQEQQSLYHRLLVNEITQLLLPELKTIQCSGFEFQNNQIKSFEKVRKLYPGNINHLNNDGNEIVYRYIREFI